MNHTCEQCGKNYYNVGTLNRHIKMVHDKIKDFHCDKCGYSCSTISTLNRHIKQVHDKIKDHHCNQCNFSFSTSSDLKTHIYNVHINPRDKKMSRGEKKIYDILTSKGIKFTREKTFPDLEGFKGQRLRFDFCIDLLDDYLFIEFDGKQHFKPCRWQKDETDEFVKDKFEQIKLYDKLKNKWCKHYQFPLLRIRYDEKNILSKIDNFLLDNV